MRSSCACLCAVGWLVAGCSGVNTYVPAGSDGGSGGTGAGVTVASTKVEPTFAYAPNWNSFVTVDATPVFASSGLGCSPTLQHDATKCVHAGTQRKFTMPAPTTSCAGLSAVDSLNVFAWTCVAGAGQATFFSLGFRPGKGLRDLIDGTTLAWRPNFLAITGAVTLNSRTSVWWPNRILALPSNANAGDAVARLDAPQTIYVATTDQSTRGFNVAADGVAVVTLGNARLSWVGSNTANCHAADGTTAAPDHSYVLCGGGQNFTWIEAALDTAGVAIDGALLLVASPFARLHRVTVTGGDVTLSNTVAPRATELRANLGDLILNRSVNGAFSDIQLGQGQLTLTSSTGNRFARLTIAGGQQGVALQNSGGNALSGLSLLGAEAEGVAITGTASSQNVLSFVTALNTGSTGIDVSTASGAGTIVHNALVANSGGAGLAVNQTGSYSHVAAINNQTNGINVAAANNKFSGVLLTGSNGGADCALTGSPSAPGLDASCNGTDLSTALTPVIGVNAGNAFRGKISTTDPTNASDVNGGAAAYPSSPASFDWINFTPVSAGPFEAFRAWSTDGGNYPAVNQRGAWSVLGGAGRIWDLALAIGNLNVRNVTGNGTSANVTPTPNTTCPPWLAGSLALTDANSTVTYLANASEVMNDFVGNDDGLCSSNEVCVAAPNFGAYQGDGDFRQQSCVFSNGAVTGVTLYFYPVNGR